MGRNPNRDRLRARQACRNCRKKKTRCPSEKPACSSCVRLNQSCVYDETSQTDRLAKLEKKVDLLLSSREQRLPSEQTGRDPSCEGTTPRYLNNSQVGENTKGLSQSTNHDAEYRRRVNSPLNTQTEFCIPKATVSETIVAHSLDVYFERFHQQPLWCFERQDIKNNTLSPELMYSILALTARFSQDHDPPRYGESARWQIMLRVANDTVELETIEGLCLLSYSAFIDGDMHLGQFYLGLGFQLCRSVNLDCSTRLADRNPIVEREKRLLWSLQSLEQFYSEHDGIIRIAPGVWRSYYLSASGDAFFPQEPAGMSTASEIGIWSLSVHFGWIWSRVREYISDCSKNKLIEPWRVESTYNKILADMTEIENKAALHHRYGNVRFYERQPDEIQLRRDYWMPWLKLQFTWHCILMALNHPFLYITASQHHVRLAIPNTFWRKSSELVLLHATWIVRTIDMIREKKINIFDPFFGHVVGIAATVHLYFCCAADSRLREKSKVDYLKCREFLDGFIAFSPACKALAGLLDRLTRLAFEAENTNDNPVQTTMHLSIPIMWAILKFDVSSSTSRSSASSARFPRNLSNMIPESEGNHSLQISVTSSLPAVTIDPAQGHDGQLPIYRVTFSNIPQLTGDGTTHGDIIAQPAENFMFSTPWLWPDPFGLGDNDGTGADIFSGWLNFRTL
ncbi:hypothetical protein BJX63DRAFT_438879 [Aspergillus granulosus]|uniref:Zn(2)-C6 fungal-type domain-containing protein n=1 Tax=Aspergillus granulosus TaxID=176169 RepID=A0ABR4I5I9_9EURO